MKDSVSSTVSSSVICTETPARTSPAGTVTFSLRATKSEPAVA